ncbi:MAG: hypothetical protein KZQ76_09410 [Candidatus Thiodiazotropha sp. (ex Epidulcina cf. delphinae)]|nr:hypothetical protein [Candidatus Thiodiazotropha sp. (ex Epidulcina cf. delphinae)]
MKYRWVVWLLLFSAGHLSAVEPEADRSPVRVFTSEEPFEDVLENIEMAIIERGLLVSGTLHVSDMLNRTGPDLGFTQVFSKARSVEFCSALMSHKMSQAAAENIAICPFTIAVYVKLAEPDKVYAAYRPPQLVGDGGGAASAIVDMLEGIIEDSI